MSAVLTVGVITSVALLRAAEKLISPWARITRPEEPGDQDKRGERKAQADGVADLQRWADGGGAVDDVHTVRDPEQDGRDDHRLPGLPWARAAENEPAK